MGREMAYSKLRVEQAFLRRIHALAHGAVDILLGVGEIKVSYSLRTFWRR